MLKDFFHNPTENPVKFRPSQNVHRFGLQSLPPKVAILTLQGHQGEATLIFNNSTIEADFAPYVDDSHRFLGYVSTYEINRNSNEAFRLSLQGFFTDVIAYFGLPLMSSDLINSPIANEIFNLAAPVPVA